MPDCPRPDLLQYAAEIGFAEISWKELQAWQDSTGTPLFAWDGLAIMELSRAYTAGVQEYQGKRCPPPWDGFRPDQKMMEENMRNMMLS